MEVKPGYKQTEVGVIPEEWEVDALGGIGRVIRGSSPRPKGDRRFYGGNVPRLMVEDVTRDRKYVTPTIDFLTVEGAKLSRPCKKGTLTVVCSGTPTVVGLPSILAVDACIHDGMLGLVHLSPSVESEYLFYRLTDLQEQLHAAATHGGTFVNLTTKGFGAFKIAVPPPPEQRAIAEALSDVDGLLGGLDRLIAKKRDLKQAAMQQLLTGQTRLPGFHGEWEVQTLFELAARKKELFDDGDWIESEHITTEGIRLIQTGNIGVGSFVEKDDKKYINETSFAALRCKQLKQGDLLVCRLADPAGRACVLGDIGEDRIVTSVDVTIFRPPAELADRKFLSQVFSTSDWFRAVSDRSGGTTHKRISRGALGRLSINLPPLPEQTAIATVLSEMDGELAVLDQRREKTRGLKQAMMQELLTGRTRLV
jgi:type I restriction enzyme S subunit